jgi:hypothetical protein
MRRVESGVTRDRNREKLRKLSFYNDGQYFLLFSLLPKSEECV